MKSDLLTESPFTEHLEAQFSKNLNRVYREKGKRITFAKGECKSENIRKNNTDVLAVLRRSMIFQKKAGSSVQLLRNGGMKNARHKR
jgi:hypothetical protein